jgi:hypothetical protein
LILDELQLDAARDRRVASSGLQRHRHRHHRGAFPERAGDCGRAILLQRADRFAHARDFERRHQARQHQVHVGTRHRECGRAEVVQRVAESVDAIPVDMRDGARGAHLEIAADQRYADGVAFP